MNDCRGRPEDLVHPVQVGIVTFLVLYHAMFSKLGADDSDGHEAMRTACATLQERLVGRSVQSAGPPRPAQSARPPLSTVLFTLLRAY